MKIAPERGVHAASPSELRTASDACPTVRGMDAYLVPLRIDRQPNIVHVTNVGPDTIFWIRGILDGPGLTLSPPTPRLDPGRAMDISVHGNDLEQETLLIIQWLRGDGQKYLCAVAL